MSDQLEYSPRLKTIMAEIQGVLANHDVGGLVILNDGAGMGEYRLFLDTPTWSNLRFMKDGRGIHFKGYSKSMPMETNKTVNMVWNQLDIISHCFLILDKMKGTISQHFKVEGASGEFYQGPGGG